MWFCSVKITLLNTVLLSLLVDIVILLSQELRAGSLTVYRITRRWYDYIHLTSAVGLRGLVLCLSLIERTEGRADRFSLEVRTRLRLA